MAAAWSRVPQAGYAERSSSASASLAPISLYYAVKQHCHSITPQHRLHSTVSSRSPIISGGKRQRLSAGEWGAARTLFCAAVPFLFSLALAQGRSCRGAAFQPEWPWAPNRLLPLHPGQDRKSSMLLVLLSANIVPQRERATHTHTERERERDREALPRLPLMSWCAVCLGSDAAWANQSGDRGPTSDSAVASGNAAAAARPLLLCPVPLGVRGEVAPPSRTQDRSKASQAGGKNKETWTCRASAVRRQTNGTSCRWRPLQ